MEKDLLMRSGRREFKEVPLTCAKETCGVKILSGKKRKGIE